MGCMKSLEDIVTQAGRNDDAVVVQGHTVKASQIVFVLVVGSEFNWQSVLCLREPIFDELD